jgi:hypothetical protein
LPFKCDLQRYTVVSTAAGNDPTLAVLLAHLCTSEFSTLAIKDNFHPRWGRSAR